MAAPAPVSAVLAMQRGVGNAATSRMLTRQKDEDDYVKSSKGGVPTFDTKAEKWATADDPGKEAKEGDGRRFGQADAKPKRQREVHKSLSAVQSVEDIDALDVDAVRDMNPQSLLPYRILRDVLHQSWHVAKEVLLDPRPEGRDARRALMTKLWEYRQWHHQEIIAEVAEELNAREKDAKALLPSKGAGSATLSSDIDVNLKGNHTELAVPLFNERFRQSRRLPQHKWDNEPGVVYDVNVYAIDFMHQFAPNEAGGRRTTQKEGGREGRAQGGIADAGLEKADRHEQMVTSLFKVRLFMDQDKWDAYQASTLRGLQGAGATEMVVAFEDAESRFAGYLGEMSEQMGIKIDAAVEKASGVDQLKAGAAAKAPGPKHDHATESKQENVLMVAANRIYERKLAAIHSKRAELKKLTGAMKGADEKQRRSIDRQIDELLLGLRGMVAESAMYANEASMTDATIHHGVVGIQGGKEIDQRKHEGINALNEHLADVMKEVGRYGPDLGPAAYKSGKYLMRLGDAAKNLGFGYVRGVGLLYELGRKISEDIKVRADSQVVDTGRESATAVRTIAKVNDLDGLIGLVMDTASSVTQEYQQERHVETEGGAGDTAEDFGYRTGAKKERNEHVLNQQMVHPADRAEGNVAEGPQEELTYTMTENELEALRRKWGTSKKS